MFCLLSGAVAAFALGLIVSGARVSGALFLPAGVCALVFALACAFPRAAAYPLILAMGLLFVRIGQSFLRFPLAEKTPLALVSGGGDRLVLRLPRRSLRHIRRKAGPDAVRAADEAVPLEISGDPLALEFSARIISFDRLYPILGGENRGVISALSRNGEILYEEVLAKNPAVILPALDRLMGIESRVFTGRIPPSLAGSAFMIFFDPGTGTEESGGAGLLFVPPES
jgi:hypothetical protein